LFFFAAVGEIKIYIFRFVQRILINIA